MLMMAFFLLSTTGVNLVINHCEANHTNVVSLKSRSDCCNSAAETSCCSGQKDNFPFDNQGSIPALSTAKCCSSLFLFKKISSVFLPERGFAAFYQFISGYYCTVNTRLSPSAILFKLFDDIGPPVIQSTSDIILKTSCMLL